MVHALPNRLSRAGRDDPTTTDPELYRIVFENERVRVLEYSDRPGDRTHAHRHPDSVLITLSNFKRKLIMGDQTVQVEAPPHKVSWHPAQTQAGENVGTTDTHVMFIEFK